MGSPLGSLSAKVFMGNIEVILERKARCPHTTREVQVEVLTASGIKIYRKFFLTTMLWPTCLLQHIHGEDLPILVARSSLLTEHKHITLAYITLKQL